MSPESEHSRELRELEPRILPRPLRALEQVATRLDDRRPVPAPAFVAGLEERIARLEDEEGRAGGAAPSAWRLASVACLVLGLALLAVALIMVAGGG